MFYVQLRYHDIVGSYLTLIFAAAIFLTLDAVIVLLIDHHHGNHWLKRQQKSTRVAYIISGIQPYLNRELSVEDRADLILDKRKQAVRLFFVAFLVLGVPVTLSINVLLLLVLPLGALILTIVFESVVKFIIK